jgi:hypothetical protein
MSSTPSVSFGLGVASSFRGLRLERGGSSGSAILRFGW